LIVGEGDAEVVFLKYLKDLYVARGSGVAVTIKNAHGKGALHVVDFAIRQSKSVQYDQVAALLDTDTDWTDAAKKKAKQGKVHVLPCNPCLEALLLSLKDELTVGRTTGQLKGLFERRFGGSASDVDWHRHLSLDAVNAKRAIQPVVNQLVHLLLNAALPR
jgi:hypothetical protein